MANFEEIYREHFQDVYRYVLSLCQNRTIAEDVTQETFYKAMEHLDKFDGKGRMYVWLCQIAKNAYYSLYRKQKRFVTASDSDLSIQTMPDFEGAYLDTEAAKKLHSLLHQLHEPYKEVFTLRVFGELPFAQIGELFGKTDSWARLIFYRAKNELRRKLDEPTV